MSLTRCGCVGLWSLVAIVCCCVSVAAERPERFEDGESVKVFQLGDWREGTVLEQNKQGQVMGEFAFAATTVKRVFDASQVIHLWEDGAIARARFWTDASGKFKTKAALIAVSDSEVTLRTPEQKELVIPISKLSALDQRFLKSLRRSKRRERQPLRRSPLLPNSIPPARRPSVPQQEG